MGPYWKRRRWYSDLLIFALLRTSRVRTPAPPLPVLQFWCYLPRLRPPFFLGGGGVWGVSEVLSQAKMSVTPYPAATQKKSAQQKARRKKTALINQNGFLEPASKRLTLRELLTATSRVQANLFTFNFAGVTSDKTSLA